MLQLLLLDPLEREMTVNQNLDLNLRFSIFFKLGKHHNLYS